ELFSDIWGPLADAVNVRGRRVADIGAGTGRFVNIFLDAGATHVVAVEPSAAMGVLKQNTHDRRDRVTYIEDRGDAIPQDHSLDFVFSIGVLHHIPDPRPVVEAARNALRPGGCFCAWLYGAEGHGSYMAVVRSLRWVAARLPHWALVALVWGLYWPLRAYMAVSSLLRVPLHDYMRRVLARLDGNKIRLVIYDQLKPAYAKYYTRDEALALFRDAGYNGVRLHHRHGYSWAVIAVNPS